MVLAAPLLPLPSVRIVGLAGAHACLSVLFTEGSGTRAYRVLDPEPKNPISNPRKVESEEQAGTAEAESLKKRRD